MGKDSDVKLGILFLGLLGLIFSPVLLAIVVVGTVFGYVFGRD